VKLILENWNNYLTEEENDRILVEEQVKKIFAEYGYTLSEELLLEIDWSAGRRLLKRGIKGLALAGALTGFVAPAMAEEPSAGECGENTCSAEFTEIDQAAMKQDLAQMIKMFIDDGGKLEDVYKMLGWDESWGSHTEYLGEKAVTTPPSAAPTPTPTPAPTPVRETKIQITKSRLKQIIKEIIV
jgi:hypothetical protein